jgi:hypothetical protein
VSECERLKLICNSIAVSKAQHFDLLTKLRAATIVFLTCYCYINEQHEVKCWFTFITVCMNTCPVILFFLERFFIHFCAFDESFHLSRYGNE